MESPPFPLVLHYASGIFVQALTFCSLFFFFFFSPPISHLVLTLMGSFPLSSKACSRIAPIFSLAEYSSCVEWDRPFCICTYCDGYTARGDRFLGGCCATLQETSRAQCCVEGQEERARERLPLKKNMRLNPRHPACLLLILLIGHCILPSDTDA